MKKVCLFIIILTTFLCAQDNLKTDLKRIESIETLIADLDKWPSNFAKRSLQRLFNEGEFSIPFLIIKLREGSFPAKEACAECLGKMKVQDAFSAISSVALEKGMRSRVSTLFRALIKIDRKKAYPVILDFLKLPTQTGRYPAFNVLSAITEKEHFSLLENTFSSKYSGTRKYVISLISRIEDPKATNFIIEAMNDPAVQVAYKAAEILGSKDSDVYRNRLLAMVDNKNKRQFAYTILALIMQEDNFNKELLDDFWIPQLLLAIRNKDRFIKGAAAVGLVNVGFRTINPEIIKLMNEQLPPLLIESIMGKIYYRDYAALRKTVYVKLKQLTGRDFGYSGTKWWSWWHQNNGRFHAVRLLKGVAIRDMDSASVLYTKTGWSVNEKILLVTNTTNIQDKKQYTQIVILDEEDMISYLNLLKEKQFFDLDSQYGTRGINTGHHVLKVKVKHLEKEIISYDKNIDILEPFIKKIKHLEKENIWQLYWDNHRYPNWLSWYRLHKSLFRRLESEEDQNAKIKEMIINSYGWLPANKRYAAAKLFLELMEKEKTLSDGVADLAFLHVRVEIGLTRNSKALIKGIALSGKEFIIIKLTEYLLKDYSPSARNLISFLLKNGTRKIATRYLKHGDPRMRSIAAEALTQFPENEITNLYLLGMINDKDITVKKSVIFALGELKVQNAIKPLTNIIQNNKELKTVRSGILKTLAKIQQEKALPILLEQLLVNDQHIRIAVAQSLGKIKTNLSVRTLISQMNGDSSREVRRVAAISLTQIGNDEVTKSLLRLAHNQITREETRILALQTLQQYKTKRITKSLRKLLKDNIPEIRIEAAFLLTKFWDKKALPVIIYALDHPRYKFSAQKYITKLSFVKYLSGDIKLKYSKWWETNKSLPLKHWFFRALKKKKYDVTPLLDYLLGETNIPEAFPLLLKVMKNEEWYLQSGANHILEQLTGQRFGEIHFFVGKDTRNKVVQAWDDWHKNFQKTNR